MNDHALCIQPNAPQGFTIAWNKIRHFEEIKISGTKLILIHVKNPDQWVQEQWNPVKRKLMQFNTSSYGTPFNITASGMNIWHKNLFETLKEFHEKYRI